MAISRTTISEKVYLTMFLIIPVCKVITSKFILIPFSVVFCAIVANGYLENNSISIASGLLGVALCLIAWWVFSNMDCEDEKMLHGLLTGGDAL